jgi:hypothetical protein
MPAEAPVGTAIDECMPVFDVRERHRTTVHAPPERVYETVRSVDLSRSGAISWLFRLRELPAVLTDRRERRLGLTLDGLLRSGFVLLEDRSGEEIVLGLVGRFWMPNGHIQRLDREGFLAFKRPGFTVATWNFHLRPSGGGVILSTETRVRCTSDASRRLFRVYWTVVGPFSGLIRREMLRLVKREAEGA